MKWMGSLDASFSGEASVVSCGHLWFCGIHHSRDQPRCLWLFNKIAKSQNIWSAHKRQKSTGEALIAKQHEATFSFFADVPRADSMDCEPLCVLQVVRIGAVNQKCLSP